MNQFLSFPARLALLVLTLAASTVFGGEQKSAVKDIAGDAAFTVTVGPEEHVPFGDFAYCPDGHIAYRKEAHGCTLWIAVAGRGTWMFRGPSFDKLSVVGKGPVLVKGGEHFDRDYAGLNSVLTSADGKELFGFYHAEFHPQAPKAFPFTASTGLATSADGGLTWKKVGQVVSGVNGAGLPSAVIHKEGEEAFVYLYYPDTDQADPKHRAATFLARSPLASGCKPGTWQKWTGKGWGAPGVQTGAEPVVTAPNGAWKAAQAHVSWNFALKRWLMVYHSGPAFVAAASEDGIHFGAPVEIMKVPAWSGQPGEVFTGYPTLLSPDHGSQSMTGADGYLYFARGPSGQSATGWRRSVNIVPEK